MIKKQKRHFQLMEIMIALLLIMACAIPMVHSYVHMYKEQRHFVRSSHLDHLAHLIYAHIIEELYQQKISWQDMEGGVERELQHPEMSKLLKKEGAHAKYSLKVKTKKSNKAKVLKHLATLTLTVVDDRTNEKEEEKKPRKEYEYVIYIARENKPKDPNSTSANNSTDQEEETNEDPA
jgi:Tfp pilus assembly protein PilE